MNKEMGMERAVTSEAEGSAQLRFERAVSAVSPEDPLSLFGALLTKAKTIWMQRTYPFSGFGRGVSIHYSCDIRRSAANRIRIGNSVYVAPGTWLNIPEPAVDAPAAIIIENGCRIGRRCMISAKNRVHLEPDVMLGPSVLITDHSHEFSNPDIPIHAQGLTVGGTVLIERNCWLGHGAAVICSSGSLSVGRNSIIGANSVVTRSVPPFSIVSGNPAKVIRRYDPGSGEWVKEGTFGDSGVGN
jgi:acetyltransferase-like isoleucine patch superfamily enzyme